MNQIDKLIIKHWRDITFVFLILFVVYELKFNHSKLLEEKIASLEVRLEKNIHQNAGEHSNQDIDQVKYESLTRRMDGIVNALKIMNSEISSISTKNSSIENKLIPMQVNLITMSASIETAKEDLISISTDIEMIDRDLDKILLNLK